jgi:hemoglobin
MPNEQSPPGGSNREMVIQAIIARTGIDEAMIERLVRTFYARARLDPLIGPIFETRVHVWEAHIGRLCAFWSSVALMSGRYHGQPMAAHSSLPIAPPHFERWLRLFAETTHEVCPPEAAAHFLERARRIADSLALGIGVDKGELPLRRPRPAPTLSPG